MFIIGNGESRKNFDFVSLKDKGPIIGCNAIYRDFVPDYIVALDRPMINEINNSSASTRLITSKLSFPLQKAKQDTPGKHLKRDRLAMLNGEVITSIDIPCHNSGMFAMYVGCKMFPYISSVYLLGFDFENENSNIYRDTVNYNQTQVKFDPEQWKELFSFFPETKFFRVGETQNSELYNSLGLETLSYTRFIFTLQQIDQMNSLNGT